MKLTLEVYSTSAGDAGGAPSFGVRIRDRRALEAGALYDPLDVNFIVDNEFLPAPETVAVSVYRPTEDGEDALVATTAGSAFAPVPGHSMMRRGALATATPGFDSWYEETRGPDGDHTYPVPVFSILEVRWSCGAEDCMARAEAVPAILTPIGVRAVKGLDGTDGEDGKAPTVDVADHGDGTYRMTVTSPDGTVQTVEWRDGRDGDGASFPVPVSPADATEDNQYADALAVQGILDRLRKDLSGFESRLDVLDSLAGVELLEGIQESLTAKVDRRVGYDLVSEEYIRALADFTDTFGAFGDLAGLDKITFTELGTDLAERFKALEAAVESLPPSGDGGTLDAGYVKFLDTVVAAGDDSAQRILDAVNLVLAESNDAGKGIWKAVNANAKGLAELEAKIGSGGSSSISAELEAMIRNSVQKDALGRGFSSNDFTQDYIDRINNSVQREAGKGLSTVDFTMERAERLDALYNSSSTLNPPVKPDENAKEGQPADAKDTYEALKGLSFTEAPDSHGSDWGDFSIISINSSGSWSFVTPPTIEWREPPVSHIRGWHLCPFEFELKNEVPAPGAISGSLAKGRYKLESYLWISDDKNLTSGNKSFTCFISVIGATSSAVSIDFIVKFSRELYIYKGDSYVTKTYVDGYVDDRIADIDFPDIPDCTDDYDVLGNKPSINGVELSGSMTAEDLGLSTVAGDADGEYGPMVAKQAARSYWADMAGSAGTAGTASEAEHALVAGKAYALADSSDNAVTTQHILDGLRAKRDSVDNIATENSQDWKISYEVYSGSEDLKLKLYSLVKNNPPLLQWDNEIQVWNWSNLPVLDGYHIESEDAGEQYARVSFVSETDMQGYGVVGDRVTVTKSGEPYITHGYVDKRVNGLVHDIVGMLLPKRNKADNIAAKDEMQFAEWKFHCDEPAIQAALDANPPKPYYDGTQAPLWGCLFPEVEGYSFNLYPAKDVFADVNATYLDFGTIYAGLEYKEDGSRDLYSVTATREKMIVTKQGEPYVTPTGVKNIAIPKYEFVDAAIADAKVTVSPYTNAKLVSDGTAFEVAVGEGDGKMRDCVLVVECGDTVPTITWGANFHPRTDAETDFACVVGVRNIYWITEYSPNEFCVAGWQETTGGNAL